MRGVGRAKEGRKNEAARGVPNNHISHLFKGVNPVQNQTRVRLCPYYLGDNRVTLIVCTRFKLN